MSSARERGQRGSSPAVARHIRPRDLHTVWMEDDFQESWLSGRDLSPRGMGKASVSAPPSAAGTPRSFSRRYSGYYLDQPDFMGHFMTLPAYSTACASRSRESSPRTRMTSVVLPYVNGDLPSAPRGRHRHKSFPEYPHVHFPQHSTFPLPLPFPKRRDVSPVHGVRHVPAGVNRLQVTGRRSGSGQGSEELSSISPPSSDDALLSVTSRVEDSGGEGCHRTGALGKEGGMEGSFSCDEGYTWHSSLTCYLCDQLFRRPRILPCGHTFCSDCLVQLKDQALHEGDKSPSGHAACLTPGRGRKTRGEGVSSPRRTAEMGAQLVCPIPGCRHSLRLMNFGRWTIRNKTVTEAVTALRRTYENRQDACTQTDISMDSVLVTLPRSLLERVSHPGMERGGLRRSPSSSLLDGMVHRALSMDCINPHYIPHHHVSWRSFVAVLGMHVLQEMLH